MENDLLNALTDLLKETDQHARGNCKDLYRACENARALIRKANDSAVIWLICPTCRDNPNACDSRPFKVTRAELVTADGFILCEYCGARCIETDTPKGK